MVRSFEKPVSRRSLEKLKVFEALLTQDFFLLSVFEVVGVVGVTVPLGKLTVLERVFDGSSCTAARLVGDSETGGLAGDGISRDLSPVGLAERLLPSLTRDLERLPRDMVLSLAMGRTLSGRRNVLIE